MSTTGHRQRRRIRTPGTVQQQAKALRQMMTPAETKLWERLRARRVAGLKFRRQHPLGPFIADFCCPACRLVIELDGSSHATSAEQDAARTRQFEEHGYRVLRFPNAQVENDIESVLRTILEYCPYPLLSSKGDGASK